MRSTCEHVGMLVDGWCYYDCKRRAGLIDRGANYIGVLSRAQERFVGLHVVPDKSDGWHPAAEIVETSDEPSIFELRLDRARQAGELPALRYELSESTANAVSRGV